MQNPREFTLSYELHKAAAALTLGLTRELEELELRPSEATLLMIIGANPGCSQSDISRAMRAKPANIVPLVNNLEHAGALERIAGEGRAVALHLTRPGRAILKKVEAAMARFETKIARGMGSDQRAQTIETLRMVTLNVCK